MKAGAKVARLSGLELLVGAVGVLALGAGGPIAAERPKAAIILRGMNILRNYTYINVAGHGGVEDVK